MLVERKRFIKHINKAIVKILLESKQTASVSIPGSGNTYIIISDIDLLDRTLTALETSDSEHGKRFEEAAEMIPGLQSLNTTNNSFPFADMFEVVNNNKLICYSAKCKKGFRSSDYSQNEWSTVLSMAQQIEIGGKECAVGLIQGWVDDSVRKETKNLGLPIRVKKITPLPRAPTIQFDAKNNQFILRNATKELALSHFGTGNPSHPNSLKQDTANSSKWTFDGGAVDLDADVYQLNENTMKQHPEVIAADIAKKKKIKALDTMTKKQIGAITSAGSAVASLLPVIEQLKKSQLKNIENEFKKVVEDVERSLKDKILPLTAQGKKRPKRAKFGGESGFDKVNLNKNKTEDFYFLLIPDLSLVMNNPDIVVNNPQDLFLPQNIEKIQVPSSQLSIIDRIDQVFIDSMRNPTERAEILVGSGERLSRYMKDIFKRILGVLYTVNNVNKLLKSINTEPFEKGFFLKKVKRNLKIIDVATGFAVEPDDLKYFTAIRILINIYANQFTSSLTSIFEVIQYKSDTTDIQKIEFEKSVKDFQLFKKAADESKLFKGSDVAQIDKEVVFYIEKIVVMIKNIVDPASINTMLDALGIDKSFLLEFNTTILANLASPDALINLYENLNKLLCLIVVAGNLNIEKTTEILKM